MSIETILLIVLGTSVLIAMMYFVGKTNVARTEKIDYLKAINKQRGEEDLVSFFDHYRLAGVPDPILNLTLYEVRNMLHIVNFIPSKDDHFTETYRATHAIADKYNTWPMYIAGRILDQTNPVSISEEDWNRFEVHHGPIQNYDLLFKYVKMKLGNHWDALARKAS